MNGSRVDGSHPSARAQLRQVVEATLFISDEPLTVATLAQVSDAPRRDVEEVLREIQAEHEARGSGIVLRPLAGGWRLVTHPATAPYLERFVLSSRHSRLTKAALETLSIVAYKQPVTRHQVSGIRGVDSSGILRALVDRGLIGEVRRDEGPGRAVLYGTTPEFLERLGLSSLSDLPSLTPLLDAAGAQSSSRAEPEG